MSAAAEWRAIAEAPAPSPRASYEQQKAATLALIRGLYAAVAAGDIALAQTNADMLEHHFAALGLAAAGRVQ